MSHTETTEAVEKKLHEFDVLFDVDGTAYTLIKPWLRNTLTTIRKETLEEVMNIAEDMKTGLTETEYAEGHPQEESYDQALTDLIATLKDPKISNEDLLDNN
jgi:hypothetical protein